MSRIPLRQGGRPERDGEQDEHPHGDAVGPGEIIIIDDNTLHIIFIINCYFITHMVMQWGR